MDKIVDKTLREKTYREQALKMYPWICALCGREFSGKELRMLTIHHKDHDHENNPLDGRNWELLCIYCHDNEHSRNEVANAYGEETPGSKSESFTSKPFANLQELIKSRK